MTKRLVVAGGILNLLFGLFHIQLGMAIHRLPQLDPEYRALMEMLNVGGTLIMFLFAWVALFRESSRIHGELLKFGIEISERTVARLMPKKRNPRSQTGKPIT